MLRRWARRSGSQCPSPAPTSSTVRIGRASTYSAVATTNRTRRVSSAGQRTRDRGARYHLSKYARSYARGRSVFGIGRRPVAADVRVHERVPELPPRVERPGELAELREPRVERGDARRRRGEQLPPVGAGV